MSSSTSTSDSRDESLYGKLVSQPAKGTRRFALIGLAIVLAFCAVTEIVHRTNPFKRTELDLTVSELNHIRGRHFDRILLGDSVTRQPLWGVPMTDGTYNMVTSAGVSPLGIELLIRRLHKQGNSVDEAVLFLSPETVKGTIWSRYFDTLFASVFDRGSEIRIVRQRFPELEYDSVTPIYRRSQTAKALFTGNFGFRRHPRLVLSKEVLGDDIGLTAPQRTIDRANARDEAAQKLSPDDLFDVGEERLRALQDLFAYLRDHDVKIKVVITPIMGNYSDIFLDTSVGRYLRSEAEAGNLTLIDIADYLEFPKEAYWDGIHLNPIWQDLYVHAINEHVAPILTDKSIEPEDLRLPDRVLSADAFYVRDHQIVKEDDETGLFSGQVDIVVRVPEDGEYCVSARALAPNAYQNSSRTYVDHVDAGVWHYNPAAPGWNWFEKNGPVKLNKGLHLFRIGNREHTPLSAFTYTPC